MCSSGDKVAKESEKAQAAFTNTLQGSFKTAFGANQAILGALTTQLTEQMNNPKGFSPKQMALMKTGSSDAVAAQTQAAQVAAGNYGASHGGAELGSGVQAQIQGSIAGAGATEASKESSNIDLASANLENENYWRSISGLTGVAQAENPAGYAGAANEGSNATANLSHAVLASQQAGWQNAFGVVSGVAGLGSAAVGGYADFAGAKKGG